MAKSYILSTQYDKAVFEEGFKNSGWVKFNTRKANSNRNNPKSSPILIHVDTYDPKETLANTKIDISTMKCVIKSATSANFTSKEKLWNNFPTVRRYIPKSQIIADIKKIEIADLNYPLIVKPTNMGTGEGIEVVSNIADLEKACANIKTMAKKNKSSNCIVSEYIVNPLLFTGRKFHFRMNWLVDSIGRSWLYHDCNILTAECPYLAEKWGDKKIHDSHRKSTADKYTKKDFVGYDLTYDQIFKQMVEILTEVCANAAVTVYPEYKYGYNMHGVDFMLSDTYSLKLIEINNQTSSRFAKTVINRGKPQTTYTPAFNSKEIISDLLLVIDSFITGEHPILKFHTPTFRRK